MVSVMHAGISQKSHQPSWITLNHIIITCQQNLDHHFHKLLSSTLSNKEMTVFSLQRLLSYVKYLTAQEQGESPIRPAYHTSIALLHLVPFLVLRVPPSDGVFHLMVSEEERRMGTENVMGRITKYGRGEDGEY